MVTHNLRYAVEYGSRLLMMHQGENVIDCAGEEKAKLGIEDILEKFNEISIECGELETGNELYDPYLFSVFMDKGLSGFPRKDPFIKIGSKNRFPESGEIFRGKKRGRFSCSGEQRIWLRFLISGKQRRTAFAKAKNSGAGEAFRYRFNPQRVEQRPPDACVGKLPGLEEIAKRGKSVISAQMICNAASQGWGHVQIPYKFVFAAGQQTVMEDGVKILLRYPGALADSIAKQTARGLGNLPVQM